MTCNLFTHKKLTLCIFTVLLTNAHIIHAENKNNSALYSEVQTPDINLKELFNAVQQSKIYADQKTFADAVPKYKPSYILKEWKQYKNKRNFDLSKFIDKNFFFPKQQNLYVPPKNQQSLREHINSLWPILTRSHSQRINEYDSLLPLPKPYIVPGGRFSECYYWDSYFTMLGLAENGKWDQVNDMIDNFASEIETYGHIPNGNRSYYLSRSQPPFFSLMIDLLASHKGEDVYRKYLPQLEREYKYWMEGYDNLSSGQAKKRLIKLSDGTYLNRYWDDRDVPRTESWMDDINTAKKASLFNRKKIYRELRAGAASGWDFSSRWFCDGKNITSICTTQLAPIDLNCLLFSLEKTLAKAATIAKQNDKAERYTQFAKKRQDAINKYLWNEENGWYADYNWTKKQVHNQLTAATLFPLYVKIASNLQAKRTVLATEKQLLKNGGLVTTTVNSSQQWDAPNGWAPLQWIAIKGLENYNYSKIANQIGQRFLQNVQNTYDKEHKLIEKYIVEGSKLGGGQGGEYPLQDGFGWTNGVTLKLLNKYCPKDKNCNSAHDIPNMPILN